MDPGGLHCFEYTRTPQITLSFVAHPACKVACPCLTMLDFARSGQAEAFFCAFMGFLLWHGCSLFRMPPLNEVGRTPLPRALSAGRRTPPSIRCSPAASIDPPLYSKTNAMEGGSLRNSSALTERSLNKTAGKPSQAIARKCPGALSQVAPAR